ncbi:MAG: cytochrome bc complex cytochrome b subunit [Gammaproteobacteria bacterium]|jgi:ubiquinol-cytochrome c reductase cytochrome b subunit|nr:cytochrome bc complex cytochrome b subunit [Gammaproteobacteria bacterium]MDP6617069.1 cytochrome bc complex cytochrome b subunit [Gammaproteobacteria bacterium]
MSTLSGKGTALLHWIDYRLPVVKAFKTHMSEYYAPRNLNFWYFFGVLAMLALASQLFSGIWLTMFYTPTVEGAFESIEYIMRDVDAGWFIRYTHEVGASFFFIVVYLHIYRGFLYGSYKEPRELLWIIGMVIYLLMMVEGFSGYVLPFGNMSYWGAKVILNLIGAIPVVGEELQIWVQGDFLIGSATLRRLFAIHVALIPLLLIVGTYLHIIALHQVGSNNPEGIDIKARQDEKGIPLDGIPFHPYYTVHDLIPVIIFFLLFFAAVFYFPGGGGYFIEPPNYLPADNLSTPEHIAPVWYYTPYYAMLRAVTLNFLGLDAKFWGLVILAGAIVIVFFLPWLDRSPVKSMRYKGIISKSFLMIWVISFLCLGVLGAQPADWAPYWVPPAFTIIYFAYFILMPFYTQWETCKTVPDRIQAEGKG